MWDPEANGKVSTESVSVETTGETAVDEAKPGGGCKLRKDSAGGETVEPMASAGGGPSRSRGGKLGGRSGKALEQTSGADRFPDRNERRETDILASRSAPGREREQRNDSGADRIGAQPAG